ncbi:hypothetical protein RHGRI_007612 [Rhododendron griersonianum]|uniref:Ubiquitin-like protease family profile domain-containing protein n=1 Tax=Rhododendron griersonianum TaxID=479676 RepID=A0AAV6KZG3_9ERIC|nr:hypothetical protein RHGRI_007612 [Rhododendron griersonianum]
MHLPTMRVTIENILKPPVKKQKKKQKQVSEIEDAKDLARLLTLYTIGTLFFPTTGPNLNWSYLKLVEDLENNANYNWSAFITNYLVNELQESNDCWWLHHCTPAQQTFPRFMKWKMNELAAKLLEAPLSSLPEGMSLLKDKKNEVRKMFLDDKLLELIQKELVYRYLVFPINSSGGNKEQDNDPYHWTVLVYDIEDGQWRHYNSIRPTGKNADAYLTDARLMKSYVEGFVKKNHTPTFMLSSQNETIFEKQKFDAPIISPASLQQRPRTVDCGIIVCYIIDKLAQGDRIPESLTTNEIRQYRVLLLQRFLHDKPRTWTEAL